VPSTRRELIFGTAGLSLAAGCRPSPRTLPAPGLVLPDGGLRSLTLEQFRILSACCERILPRDEDPGATDLGCAHYVDRLLADPEARALWGRAILGGLPVLDQQAQRRWGRRFFDAAPAEQDELLAAWQGSRQSGEAAFFEVLHALTLEGAFGAPIYGGNRAGAGFALTGFEPGPPVPRAAGAGSPAHHGAHIPGLPAK
jgi:gluconate 2-dehydrogenase gamma chain